MLRNTVAPWVQYLGTCLPPALPVGRADTRSNPEEPFIRVIRSALFFAKLAIRRSRCWTGSLSRSLAPRRCLGYACLCLMPGQTWRAGFRSSRTKFASFNVHSSSTGPLHSFAELNREWTAAYWVAAPAALLRPDWQIEISFQGYIVAVLLVEIFSQNKPGRWFKNIAWYPKAWVEAAELFRPLCRPAAVGRAFANGYP